MKAPEAHVVAAEVSLAAAERCFREGDVDRGRYHVERAAVHASLAQTAALLRSSR